VFAGIGPTNNGKGVTVMNTVSKISEAERSRRERQRAMSIDQFCERYNIGRTKAYEEINEKRLKARKCGARTIVTEDDAEEWLRSLPQV
jgi:helix-turn-helix protein